MTERCFQWHRTIPSRSLDNQPRKVATWGCKLPVIPCDKACSQIGRTPVGEAFKIGGDVTSPLAKIQAALKRVGPVFQRDQSASNFTRRILLDENLE